jgi:hypothetical protein
MNPVRSVGKVYCRRSDPDEDFQVRSESGEKVENPLDVRLVFDGATPTRLVVIQTFVLEPML